MRNLKAVFSNNEGNIIPYCIYRDLEINAVIGLDGKLQICDEDKKGERCSMFFLSEDKIYNGVIVKSMKMSEFIDMSKDQKVDYIDLCNTTQAFVSRCKIDEVDMYRKPILDRYLKEHKDANDSFLFLHENGLMANCDDDKISITMSMAVELSHYEVKQALTSILKEADVSSFDELFRLVKMGREQTIKN